MIQDNQIAIIMTKKFAGDLMRELPDSEPISVIGSLKERIRFGFRASKKHADKKKEKQSGDQDNLRV